MSFSSRVLVATSSSEVPKQAIDGKPTLVYWNICGLAQAIRMALALGGADFSDVRIEAGTPETADYKQAWLRAKPELAEIMAFPNLPYYMDGTPGMCMTQSNAILKHIGRKYRLLGPPEQEYIVDMVLDQLVDMDGALVRLAYRSETVQDIQEWTEGLVPQLLAPWERLLLDQNKTFLTGDKPTVADLKLYEVLRKIHILEVELCGKEQQGSAGVVATIGGSERLAAFVDRVEAVPRLKAYLRTSSFLARPLNNPHAKFA